MRLKTNFLCLSAALLLTGCANDTIETADPEMPVAPASAEAETPAAADEEPGPWQTTDSGLKYRIYREGTGESPTASDTVVAHYRGWLDDGTEFDSSYSRGEPTEFPMNIVIGGWTEGLQLIKEGGKIELEIPAELGYGADGRPGIPPNATLHFIVELVEVA